MRCTEPHCEQPVAEDRLCAYHIERRDLLARVEQREPVPAGDETEPTDSGEGRAPIEERTAS